MFQQKHLYLWSYIYLGVTHISNLPTHGLRQIDASGWMGLAHWREDFTDEILIFISSTKEKLLKNPFPIAKKLNFLHDLTLKI